MGFLADAARHFGPQGFEHVFGLVAAERGQGAGQHIGLTRQGQAGPGAGNALGPSDTTGPQLFHHFAVVSLIEKRSQALRHDGPNIRHLQQLVDGGIHDGVHLAEMAHQLFGRGLAHMANAQTKQKTGQGGWLGFFNAGQHIVGGFFSHAVQGGQGGEAQAVHIGQGVDQAFVNKLLHQFVAQVFNVHRTAMRKVQDGLLALGAAKQTAGAAVVGLAFVAHRRAVAHRTLVQHGEYLRVLQTFFQHHRHHLGNHIACAAHHHGVAHPHVFAAGFVFVVQSGVGDGDPADKHRCQLGHRRELASAPHLNLDGLHRGEFLLRGVFVRHRPARLAGHEAQLPLCGQAVHFVNHTVNVKGQGIACLTDALVKAHQTGGALHHAGLHRHREAPLLQCHQQLKMSFKGGAALFKRCDVAQPISKEAQRSLRGDAGVELTHGTSGGIARVDKGFFALVARRDALSLALVQGFKVRTRHINLAAHFQQRWHRQGGVGLQTQRNLPDGADVVGHVLAHVAVASGGGLHQNAVLVAQAHGQAVKFQLGHIVHSRVGVAQAQFFADACVKGFGTTGFGVGFGADAQHRQGMFDAGKTVQGLAAHPLGRRIGRDQFGVRGFQGLQRLEQPVVLGIRQRGRI